MDSAYVPPPPLFEDGYDFAGLNFDDIDECARGLANCHVFPQPARDVKAN